MQNYKPGTLVPLIFSLVNEAGVVLTPTALNWRILDESENELQAWAPITPLPATAEVTVTIPSPLTALTPPALKGLRVVELEVVTDAGSYSLSESVLISGPTILAFGINTFQTYGQATLLSQDYVETQLAGWAAASRENREKAMIEAYGQIMQMPIGQHFDTDQSRMNVDVRLFGGTNLMLRDVEPEHMINLKPELLTALRQAQVIEADDILTMNPVSIMQRQGLLSMTVGESHQSFRLAKPLDMPICQKAMNHLQRWIRYGARIGRS